MHKYLIKYNILIGFLNNINKILKFSNIINHWENKSWVCLKNNFLETSQEKLKQVYLLISNSLNKFLCLDINQSKHRCLTKNFNSQVIQLNRKELLLSMCLDSYMQALRV